MSESNQVDSTASIDSTGTARRQCVQKWANSFSKVGGPLSFVATIMLVTVCRPSPGHLLPFNWSLLIFILTFAFIAGSYGLGALVGLLVWSARKGDPTSTTERTDP